MRWLNWISLTALMMSLLAPTTKAAPAPTKKSALAIVPVEAPIVLHVHGLKRTIDRVIAMVNNVDERSAKQLRQFSRLVFEMPDGRTIEGLDPDGHIFLAFMKVPTGPAALQELVIFAKTKDYTKFRDGLLLEDEAKTLTKKEGYEAAAIEFAEAIYFVKKDGYTAITPSEKLAKMLTQKYKGLDTRISKDQGSRLLKSDVAVYIALNQFAKTYAEEIKAAKEAVKVGLEEAIDALEGAPGQILKKMKDLIGPVFQMVEDSRGALLSLTFDPKALAIHIEAEMQTGSPTAKLLKTFSTGTLASLGRMPKGQMLYGGWQSNAQILNLFGSLIKDLGGENPAINKGLQELSKAGPGEHAFSMNLPTSGVQSWEFEKPDQALAAMKRMVTNMSKDGLFKMMPLKNGIKVKEKAATHQKVDFCSVQMSWDLKKMIAQMFPPGAPVPDQVLDNILKVYQQVLGESITVWFGVKDKRLIVVADKDWKSAKEKLDQSLSDKSVGTTEAFKEVRKHLPEKSTMMGIVDLESYVEVALGMIKRVAGDQLPFDLPNGKPSGSVGYAGVALTLTKERAAFDFVLTTQAAKNVGQRWIFPLIYTD